MDIAVFNSFFQEIFTYVVITIIGFGLLVIKKWFTDVKQKQDKMQGCLDTVNSRGVRHAKAFLEIGEHLDEETERLHPDRSPRMIKDRLQRIIIDDKGNL